MTTITHNIGPYNNANGLLITADGNCVQYTETAVLLYTDAGLTDPDSWPMVMKLGSVDSCKRRLQKMAEVPENTQLITFDNFKAFNADDICTILNICCHSPSRETLAALFAVQDIQKVKDKIHTLQTIGY